jgi:hypothetical protein
MRSRSLLAVTFRDVLSSRRDEKKLAARLSVEAGPHCSKVALVSSEDAARAQVATRSADLDLWRTSGGSAVLAGVQSLVSQVISQRLSSAERLLQSLLPREEPSFALLPDDDTVVPEVAPTLDEAEVARAASA